MIAVATSRGPGVVSTAVLLGTFSPNRAEPLHDLLGAARAGDQKAIDVIVERVRTARTPTWLSSQDAVVVAVPGHRPGPANPLVVAVAEAIAAAHGWDYLPNALRRLRPGPLAKVGGARFATAEARALEWMPHDKGSIVLVDDVVRSGTTLEACALAIRAAGDNRRVSAVAVARRRDPSSSA